MIKSKIVGDKPLHGWWVLYERDSGGQVHRLHKKVRADQKEYPHEEQLMGWPETKVFWSNDVGQSYGVAF